MKEACNLQNLVENTLLAQFCIVMYGHHLETLRIFWVKESKETEGYENVVNDTLSIGNFCSGSWN